MMNYGNELINQLVIELSKANPDTELVKSRTKDLGIPYNPDIIILMSDVLVYLSQIREKKSAAKEKLA